MARRLSGLGAIAAGVLVIGSAGGLALSQNTGEDGAPVLTPGVTPDNATPAESDGPELTDAQKASIPEILKSSPTAAPFLKDRNWSIQNTGAWTTGGNTERLIGALVVLTVGNACDAQPGTSCDTSYGLMNWPLVEFDPSSPPYYRELQQGFAASGVNRLLVNIDMTQRRVVGVQPGNDAQVSYPR